MSTRWTCFGSLALLALAACDTPPASVVDAGDYPPADSGPPPEPCTGEECPVRDGCADGTHEIDVPLRVVASEPTSTGTTSIPIPFARALGLRSLDRLAILDAEGRVLSAQIETLSRWGSAPSDCAAPIRWAHAVTRDGTPARLVWTRDSTTSAAAIELSETPSSISIDTGAARFELSRGARVAIASMGIGENPITRDGGVFVTIGGQRFDAGAGATLEIERRGAERVTLLSRGRISADGLPDVRTTVRYHFTRGSGTLEIEPTIYHAEVSDYGTGGLTNTITFDRIDLAFAIDAARNVGARLDRDEHAFEGDCTVSIRQRERTPSSPALQASLEASCGAGETTERARRAFLRVQNDAGSVTAVLARLSDRDPQGLSWEEGELHVSFASEPITVGGGRGIFGVAAIDVASTPRDPDAVLASIERPALAVPAASWLRSSGVLSGVADGSSTATRAALDRLDALHGGTVAYYEEERITGLQIWPDLPRDQCALDGTCGAEYFGGGSNDYWNWAKAGFDQFFATGDARFVHDFSRWEAMLFAETTAVRLPLDRIGESGQTGMAPCYGDGYGYGSEWREGLNQRLDACPGDYTYNKALRWAYLVTADRRYIDFFEQAAEGAAAYWGDDPPATTSAFEELGVFRYGEQRLENLVAAAEILDGEIGDRARTRLAHYVDQLLDRVLLDGHACGNGGTGSNDVRALGRCDSIPGWMLPTVVDLLARYASWSDHARLRAWLDGLQGRLAEHMTVADAAGDPDISERRGAVGWRTGYSCDVDAAGAVSGCARWTEGLENDGYYYANGLVSFLNVHAQLALYGHARREDLCRWFPGAYEAALGEMSDIDMNGGVWGKSPGQAFAFEGAALELIEGCSLEP